MRMMLELSKICLLWLFLVKQGGAFITRPVSGRYNLELGLFDWLKSGNNVVDKKSSEVAVSSGAVAGKKADKANVDKKTYQLEKISNKQNRNYEAEAKAKQAPPPEPKDKQKFCYNYNKPNEFPNLYNGWIKNSNGDQIAQQSIAAVKAALSKNEKYLEVLFDPVPNLDEVAFGTEWNQRFRKDVVANLQVPEFVTNRGGPSTLEWSNIYWANRLAAAIISKGKEIVIISLSGEGTKGANLPTLTNGVSLMKLSDVNSPAFSKRDNSNLQAFIMLSPCQEDHYKAGVTLNGKYNAPVIALNSPFSFRYDVGGGAPYNLVYVMKRISKGWIYRQYPKSFEAIVEGPDYEIFRAGTFPTQPRLPDIAALTVKASNEKYGVTGNDRIFQNRL